MTISPAGAGRTRNVTSTSTSGRFTTGAGPAPSETTVQTSLAAAALNCSLATTRRRAPHRYPADPGRAEARLVSPMRILILATLLLIAAAACDTEQPGPAQVPATSPTATAETTLAETQGRNPRARRTAHCRPGEATHPDSCTRTCACRYKYASSPSDRHTAASSPDGGHGGTDMAGADCRGGVPVLSV